MYRISSLESQLKLCQNKLTDTVRTYDSKLTQQHLKHKQLLEEAQREHDAEMKKTLQRIENLEKKIAELDNSVNGDAKTSLQAVPQPPPLQPKSPTRRKRRSRNKEESPLHSNTSKPELDVTLSPPQKHQPSSDSDLLSYSDRPKSSSHSDLTTSGLEEKSTGAFKLPTTPQVSPANSKKNLSNGKMGRRDSSEKGTITSLVAESLKNPSSMLAIKKELKSDGFTPKIQRKFHQKSSPGNPVTLLSINPSTNGGGVTKGTDLVKEH